MWVFQIRQILFGHSVFEFLSIHKNISYFKIWFKKCDPNEAVSKISESALRLPTLQATIKKPWYDFFVHVFIYLASNPHVRSIVLQNHISRKALPSRSILWSGHGPRCKTDGRRVSKLHLCMTARQRKTALNLISHQSSSAELLLKELAKCDFLKESYKQYRERNVEARRKKWELMSERAQKSLCKLRQISASTVEGITQNYVLPIAIEDHHDEITTMSFRAKGFRRKQ